MSARSEILDQLLSYGGGLVWTLALATGRPPKTVERTLALLIRSGDARAFPFLGRKKFYAPTPKAARRRDLTPRKYERPPGPKAIVERLALMLFCRQTGFRLLSRAEFEAGFPEQARVPGVSHARYHLDLTHDTPRLCVPLFDFGTSARRVCRRARREVHARKRHQPFRDLIYHKLFSVTVITAFESKAERVRAALANEPFLHRVVVVRDIESLLLPGEAP